MTSLSERLQAAAKKADPTADEVIRNQLRPHKDAVKVIADYAGSKAASPILSHGMRDKLDLVQARASDLLIALTRIAP